MVPSLLLVSIAHGVHYLATGRLPVSGRPNLELTVVEFVGLSLFAPVVETLLLAITLKLVLKITSRPGVASTIAAVVWGLLHGAVSAVWFFGTVWSFFVFAWSFQEWRKVSFRHAFVAAAVPHSLINASVFLFVLALGA